MYDFCESNIDKIVKKILQDLFKGAEVATLKKEDVESALRDAFREGSQEGRLYPNDRDPWDD